MTSEQVRVIWKKLRLVRFSGSILVDYRILKNCIKNKRGF